MLIEVKRYRASPGKGANRIFVVSKKLEVNREYTVIVTDVPLTVQDAQKIVNVLLRVQKMCFNSGDIECADTINTLMRIFMPSQKELPA